MNRPGSWLAGAALVVVALVVFGACHNGGGGKSDGFTQTVQNGETTGHVDMNHPKVPKDFPITQVPLPQAGTLQAVVSGRDKPNQFYSFTYSLKGKNGRAVGSEYRRSLEKAGFKIHNYSSSGGSDGGFTTFDATSPRWDLSVVAGKGSLLEQPSLSLQVTTHGTLSDNLNELHVLDNGTTNATIDPNDPNSQTTTTTIPLNGN